jgi:hypothetical protein
MIVRYNRISFVWGVPGIILQVVGQVMSQSAASHDTGIGILGLGTLLLLVGLAYYARAKGRSPLWCLMAFLSVIGLLVLATLSDKAVGEGETPNIPEKENAR